MLKRIIFLLGLLACCTPCLSSAYGQESSGREEEKTAILLVHFGTTYDDARSGTLDAFNDKVREAFPGIRVEEAYTSRVVMARLKKRGIVKRNPREALLRLAADGVTHVVIQGTNILDGIESEALREEARQMAPFFDEIRVGRPLLYSVEDCERVVSVMADLYRKHADGDAAVVFVGHGTSVPANAVYSQIDYMFAAGGMPNFHVATVEGYPTCETVLAKLKAGSVRKVTLVPFLFVAGDHARNDIDGEWRTRLEKAGFSVGTIREGLGQIPGIQCLYMDHIEVNL